MPRRTKIVATPRPATDDPAVLAALVAAGLDVARINFPHGFAGGPLDRVPRPRAQADRHREALAVAAKAGVDWLALSFVRGPAAADELRKAAAEVGLAVPVMAKIERPEAVRRAGAIVIAFDGVMVARGDLGVETPLEELPMVQKRLIAEARAHGKPVVTATEMLDS